MHMQEVVQEHARTRKPAQEVLVYMYLQELLEVQEVEYLSTRSCKKL